MKLEKLSRAWNALSSSTKKNSPEILTGLAVVGLIATAIAAYKAGPRAEKILAEKKKDMEYVDQNDKVAKRTVMKETVKELVPVMAPVIIMGGATCACIIGSNNISSKRIALLSAAYSMSETAVKDLNQKMVEVLGEKKALSVKDAVMKEKLAKDGPVDTKGVIIGGSGDVLCKDSFSGRYFKSNAEKIGQAKARLSLNAITDMYVSLNDLYEEINAPGLEPIPRGNEFGWNVDDLEHGVLPIRVVALLTEDGQPCLCMDYDTSLRRDYKNLH